MESGTDLKEPLPPLEVLGAKFSQAQQQLTEVEVLYKQIGRRITTVEQQAKKLQAQLYKSQTVEADTEKIDFLKGTVIELELKHKRAEKCKERLQNYIERLAVVQVMYATQNQNQIIEEIIEEDQDEIQMTNDNNSKNGTSSMSSLDSFQTRARRQTRIIRSNLVFEIAKFKAKFKVCILGPQCGKSAFLYRFVTGEWTQEDSPTVEHTYYKKFLPNTFEEYQLEILDTSGDDTYNSLRAGWYQSNNDGFILFLNTTSKSSYEEIKIFHKHLLQAVGKTQVPKIIVATAIDAVKSRVVSRNQLIELSQNFGCPFIEVSAKTGAYVEESFKLIIQQIQQCELVKGLSQNLKKVEAVPHAPVIPLHLVNQPKQTYRGSTYVGRHLISEFQNVGTLLSHSYDGQVFSVFDMETPLRCWKVHPEEQVAVTLTKADELKFVHLATKTTRTQIDMDEAQEKATVTAILLANLPKTNIKTGELQIRKCVVFVTSNKLFVHDLPTNPWKLEFDNKPIREIHLNDNGKSYSLPTQFNADFSNFVDYSRFVLAGAFGFQVWWHDIYSTNVTKNGTQICDNSKLMLKYDSEQHGIQESFLGITVCASAIVARTSSRCLLWELPTLQTDIVGPITISPPKKNILFTASIVDTPNVITGDNKGGISVWSFNGKLVRVLNESRKRSTTTAEDEENMERSKSHRSLFGHSTFRGKESGSTSALGVDLTNRITDLLKVGKILFAASADSHIYIHDISKAKQAPLEVISLNHFIPKSLHVILEEGIILCKAQKKVEKGSGQNVTPVSVFRWKWTDKA